MSMNYGADRYNNDHRNDRLDRRTMGGMPGAAGADDATRQDMQEARQNMHERNDEATKEQIAKQEDQQSMGEYIGDAGVTAKVKMKFVGQSGLDSLKIKVITVNGVVTLMGEVNESSQIELAEKAAREVKGVNSVENKLVVKG